MLRLSMFWQVFVAFSLLTLVSLGALGFVAGAWVEHQAIQQIEAHLKAKAIFLQEIARTSPDTSDLQARVESLRSSTESRITMIGPDGRVVVESDRSDLANIENHGDRPEIEMADTVPFGVSTRYSSTVKKDMMYVALRTTETPSIAYVRVATPLADVQLYAARLRYLVWGTAGATALIAIVLTWWLTRRILLPIRELSEGAKRISAGDYGHKVYIDRKDEVGQLAATFNHMSLQLADQFARLDEDRQQLRAVLSGMVEGVIAIDANQTILFANERAAQIWDFPARTAAGRKLWELIRQHDVQDLVRAAMREAGDEAQKLEFADPSGKSLLVHVAPLAGNPMRGAVLVFHDMTELRRLERLREDFVANVSHELKTPLSVITACVETLVEGAVDDLEHRGRFLERIHEQTQRLHTLILDLLSLARIESGEQTLSVQALSVAEIARACIERHQARTHARQQTLRLETPAEQADVKVLADVEALSEILDNLVDNAVKYTPPGGTISVRWGSDGGMCKFEIADTGIGIPESDIGRIFERFYRVDKARSRELGGTGLGLSIVKHLVQALHGTIQASSEVGKGTTFTVRLPRA